MLSAKVRAAMWRKLAWVNAVESGRKPWAWYYACAIRKGGSRPVGVWW
jgi:hypothetical protein